MRDFLCSVASVDKKNVVNDLYCIGCGTMLKRPREPMETNLTATLVAQDSTAIMPQIETVLMAPFQTILTDEETLEKEAILEVGGWLKWFCIQLCILGPLFDLAACINNPTPFTIFFLIAFTAFRVYVAISIFKKSPKAIRNVKLYLVAVFLIGALLIGMGAILSTGPDSQKDVNEAFKEGFRSLVSAIIWSLYFQRSHRVRQTLGRNLF